MIRITSLEKRYPNPEGGELTVLKIGALEVADEETVALAGSSGSGKTTLLNIICGLVSPSAGEVWVAEEPVHKLQERQRDLFRARNIGIVFQTFHLLPGYSALENVLLAMSFANKVPKGEREVRARRLLDQVGLGSRTAHRPAQLSTGQQQRVAIARALANGPRLLIADEPTASVDAETALVVMDLLEAVRTENRATLLVASHDPLVLDRSARRVRLSHVGEVVVDESARNAKAPTNGTHKLSGALR